MASIYKRSYRDKNGNKKQLTAWYIKYKDGNGEVRRVKGYTSKEKTRVLAAQLEAEAAQGPNPYSRHQKRPLGDHVADYRRSMEAKERTASHVDQTIKSIERIAKGCDFQFYAEIDPTKVEAWLARQRGDDFGIRTRNYHLQAFKQFCRWMVRNDRAAKSPVAHLSRLNAEVDQRLQRRAMSADEFDRLIAAARVGTPFRNLSGEQRAMLYLVASVSGLRASELHSLTGESFDLMSEPPTVTVGAQNSKRRKMDTVPLPCWIASILRLPPGRVWPGGWHKRAAEMLRRDMKTARDAWLKEVEDDEVEAERRAKSDFLQPETVEGKADFHALRGQFITSLAKAGVHPRTAQKLARHSDVKLTLERYTRVDLSDLAEAANKLPQPADWPKNWPKQVGSLEELASPPVKVAYDNSACQETRKALQNKAFVVKCRPLAVEDRSAPC